MEQMMGYIGDSLAARAALAAFLHMSLGIMLWHTVVLAALKRDIAEGDPYAAQTWALLKDNLGLRVLVRGLFTLFWPLALYAGWRMSKDSA